jgi:hypothetical protein
MAADWRQLQELQERDQIEFDWVNAELRIAASPDASASSSLGVTAEADHVLEQGREDWGLLDLAWIS